LCSTAGDVFHGLRGTAAVVAVEMKVKARARTKKIERNISSRCLLLEYVVGVSGHKKFTRHFWSLLKENFFVN
jgi:hypothetical protein